VSEVRANVLVFVLLGLMMDVGLGIAAWWFYPYLPRQAPEAVSVVYVTSVACWLIAVTSISGLLALMVHIRLNVSETRRGQAWRSLAAPLALPWGYVTASLAGFIILLFARATYLSIKTPGQPAWFVLLEVLAMCGVLLPMAFMSAFFHACRKTAEAAPGVPLTVSTEAESQRR